MLPNRETVTGSADPERSGCQEAVRAPSDASHAKSLYGLFDTEDEVRALVGAEIKKENLAITSLIVRARRVQAVSNTQGWLRDRWAFWRTFVVESVSGCLSNTG